MECADCGDEWNRSSLILGQCPECREAEEDEFGDNDPTISHDDMEADWLEYGD